MSKSLWRGRIIGVLVETSSSSQLVQIESMSVTFTQVDGAMLTGIEDKGENHTFIISFYNFCISTYYIDNCI